MQAYQKKGSQKHPKKHTMTTLLLPNVGIFVCFCRTPKEMELFVRKPCKSCVYALPYHHSSPSPSVPGSGLDVALLCPAWQMNAYESRPTTPYL
jgi:hypothetical protein